MNQGLAVVPPPCGLLLRHRQEPFPGCGVLGGELQVANEQAASRAICHGPEQSTRLQHAPSLSGFREESLCFPTVLQMDENEQKCWSPYESFYYT